MDPALGPYCTLPDQINYMIWGDRLVIDAASQLPEPEYLADRKISAGSLHLLLLHAMGAQWAWLNRLRRIPGKLYLPDEFPTRDALITRWPQLHDELRAWLREQTADSLAQPLTFTNFQGQQFTLTTGHAAMHMADHGTFHRGQQNTLLKLAGGTPVRAWYYLWAVENLPVSPTTTP